MRDACEAAGITVPDPGTRWDRHTTFIDIVQGWLDAGATHGMIVEVITERRRGKDNIRSLLFFDSAVREAAASLIPGSSVSRADMAMVEDILKRKALREAAQERAS